MDHYQKTLYIPKVDENDTVLGKVERWEAHKKGILHRGFTVALLFDGAIVCQHRKHPVFDGFLDLTASSHPFYEGETLQGTIEAVENCLQREWNVKKHDLDGEITLHGKVVYDSKHGDYIEHEVCHLYIARTKKLPVPNMEFAYGYSVIPLEQLQNPDTNPVLRGLAPWVQEMVMKDLLKNIK